MPGINAPHHPVYSALQATEQSVACSDLHLTTNEVKWS